MTRHVVALLLVLRPCLHTATMRIEPLSMAADAVNAWDLRKP